MNKIINIAVDGPSGAGKSTVSKLLSSRLGILYLDTGAMYRCLGLKALNVGLNISDVLAVDAFLSATNVEVRYTNGLQEMFLDGENVTALIRRHDVSKMASDISALIPVRIKMANMQREIAAAQSCILDGREIGTFVLPNADYKFYMTAAPEIRANRRYLELQASGQQVEFERVLSDINQRDYNDMSRTFAPLKCAEDAVVIDTDNLSIEQVTERLLSYIKLGENTDA